MTATVAVLPGDGVGREVTGAALDVLAALALDIDVVGPLPVGWATFEDNGHALPPATLAVARNVDAVLFGAISSPTGGAPGYTSPVLTLRRELGLYANLRPVRSLPLPNATPDIDLMIVRENSEGLYIRQEHERAVGEVVAERLITRAASARIARVAAARALARRGLVTIAHKANVLTQSDGLFCDVVRETIATVAPSVTVNERIVDALAHDLVLFPHRFDVIVAPNLYGDILSDLACALVGGLGVAPSANLGDSHALFEPVHGSAPDIAGQGVANPTAALLSLALLLQHLGETQAARRLQDGVTATLAAGPTTPDLGGDATTAQFTHAVMARL